MYKSIEDCVKVTQVLHRMLQNLGFNAPEVMIIAMFLKEGANFKISHDAASQLNENVLMQELEKVMKHGSN